MNILEIVFAFMMFWCLALFIVMPLMRRKGDDVQETPRLKAKFLTTTIVAAFGTATLWLIDSYNVIVLLP